MRAVRYLGPSRLDVVDKPDLTIGHPGDAIVRVTRSGLVPRRAHASHWVPLLLADRLDLFEHRAGGSDRALAVLAVATGVGLGLTALAVMARREGER